MRACFRCNPLKLPQNGGFHTFVGEIIEPKKYFSKMKKNNICIFSQNLSPKSFSWKIDKRSEINKGKFIKKIWQGHIY